MDGLLGVIIPESTAVTNLCTNPSFETGTTGWTTGGTNTIAQSSTVSRRGVYSLKCTYQDNVLLSKYTLTLPKEADYIASIDVYVPSDYDGIDNIIFRFYNFSYTSKYDAIIDITKKGGWQRVVANIYATSTDLIGEMQILLAGSFPTVGKFIYIDGVQIVALDHDVTYIDGTQADCYWTGTDHASTSVRLANSREGGQLVDLEDYNFYLEAFIGSGMAGVSPLLQDSGILPGAIDAGEKITARTMSVVGTVKGTSQSNLHANRQSIIDAIKSDRVKNRQQFWLVYEGANSTQPTRIKCKYAGGMTTNEQIGFTEKLGIRLVSTDPFWYEDGEQGAVLDTNTELTSADYILKRNSDGTWEEMTGVTGYVGVIAQNPITKEIYIGGNFTNAGGDASADYLAKWNGSAWVAVISGFTGYVGALKFDSHGNLYVGGNFTDVGDVNGDYIVKIDTYGSVSSLGTGLDQVCYAIEIDDNDNIFVAGAFTSAGGVANTARIAKWNGTSWNSVGNGISSGVVYALAFNKDYSILYIGGSFTNHVDAAGDGITEYTVATNSFASIHPETSPVPVIYDIKVAENGLVYFGGEKLAGYFACWDGKRWLDTNVVPDNVIYDILIHDNIIYISGGFTYLSGLLIASYIAIFNGSTIAHFDLKLPGTSPILGLFLDIQNNLYVGYQTTGTAYVGAINTVTNNSTTISYPKVTFKRSGGTSATVAYLKNETTGATIWLNYPLQDGETLTLDFNLKKREVISSSRGNVIGTALLRNSDFSDFYLLPGENKINAYVIEVGSPTVTALMSWKITHWSADGSA